MIAPITVTRRIQFCAGHRVMGHEGKCAGMHGHNYVALITAEGINEQLDEIGRVVDFSVLKDLVGGWIESHWDHAFIYQSADREVAKALDGIAGQRIFVMDDNPTAENMATYLFYDICPTLLEGWPVNVTRVRIWETENCYAEVAVDNSLG